MPPKATITITPTETLTTILALLALLFIGVPLFILPVTLLLLLLLVQPLLVYFLIDKLKDLVCPPRVILPIDNTMPPTNYLAAAAAQGRAKTSNETTKLLNATRIQKKWKGKARARDLEAQTPIEQLDGPPNSRQKAAAAEKKDVADQLSRKVLPASSESGPSEVLPRESPIRYYQNSIVDDWPTSCTMVTAVLTVGAMTLLLIVFFGNLEIRRPNN
ncbi:uncharacterized protein LAJ45_07079 [Morchella importuna]|uniref:uncharacterized protein n=1 Tax=Morchella importuna TaxID=1174673 RepID=UPI001E8DED3E|nr:uncharacterized protein LAJ45_07079 [Morchella importuna]KAH8148736.1 hypothetical protein LAJ45_07079 [Morchella importuna]